MGPRWGGGIRRYGWRLGAGTLAVLRDRLANVGRGQRADLARGAGSAEDWMQIKVENVGEAWARLSRGWRPLLDRRIEEMQRLRDRLDSCIGCGCLSLKTCALSNPNDIAATTGAGARWRIVGDD